jgi:transposase
MAKSSKPSKEAQQGWQMLGRVPDALDFPREEFRQLALSAEFRELPDAPSQIMFFRDLRVPISYRQISMLLGIPLSTVYLWEKRARQAQEEPVPTEMPGSGFSGPNAFLTLGEEEYVLRWIEQRQVAMNCPSPKETREYALDLRKLRVDDGRIPTRAWWWSFRRRHADRVGTKTVKSLETGRNQVTPQQVYAYREEVKNALSQIVDRSQVVNLDESGATSRPDKGKRKKVVYSLHTSQEPTFTAENDVSHVTIVSAVSLAGETLPPMFLTTTRVVDKCEISHDILTCYEVFKTAKGYQTGDSMNHYVHTILAPYCQAVRRKVQNPNAPIFLIMDNCDSHKREDTMHMFGELNVQIIWLPAHSSHFLQTLDVGIFAAVKLRYSQLRREQTKPKVLGKILRLAEAWHEATSRERVIKAWAIAGLIPRWERVSGLIRTRICVSDEKFEELIRKHCQ